MEDRCKKSSAASSIPSPQFLRRRLSAPETIMRKHMLVQQRSNSQESDTTQTSDVRSCQWRLERGIGSDSNLNKKRDYNLMRKSTLMRRLWCTNKPLLERSTRFSTSFYDWQYIRLSQGKSTRSLDSTQSSPEHLKYRTASNDEMTTTPAYEKHDFSKKAKVYSKLSLKTQTEDTNSRNNNEFDQISALRLETMKKSPGIRKSFKTPCCSNCMTSFEDRSTTANNGTLSATKTSVTATTETESEYYSTRSISTTGTTTYSDNSDSAYTNGHTSFTSNRNSSMCTTTQSSERFVEENGNVEENENANELKHMKFTQPETDTDTYRTPQNVNDSSTQTSDTANVNVISNVQLSQSTLNLIFNQVMQDVKKFPSTNINVNTLSASLPLQPEVNNAVPRPKVIEVQEVPSFYLKQKDQNLQTQEQHRMLKFMVSKVGTGSPYSKPTEVPQVVVPRYSALPRTTSMEVNHSSGESTDRESDNISLVDSLEDPSSPRVAGNQNNKYDDKPVRGDLSPLLPDNSSSQMSYNKVEAKSSAFFIPIEQNVDADNKSVADHLPEKVKERLSKRQLKREQKLRQTKDKIISPKSDSNYVSASDNGNYLQCAVDNVKSTYSASDGLSSNVNSMKNKRRNKPTLPSIESAARKSKAELKHLEFEKIKDRKINKLNKRKIMSKSQELNRENPVSEKKQSQWMPRPRQKVLERLSPLYATKNEYVYSVIPRKNFHKADLCNLDKRIEILEIVECIEALPKSSMQHISKFKKSKIPVLVNSRLPSISKNDKSQKPAFLDFDQTREDEPKIDQLIANILIDTLNKSELHNLAEDAQKLATNALYRSEKEAVQASVVRSPGNKYHRTFEAIPEERATSVKSSSEDISNSANNNKYEKVGDIDVTDSPPSSTFSKLRLDVVTNKTVSENNPTSKSAGYKGKTAVGIMKDEHFSNIPKGWITFYTLRKSQGSPESTSDEGRRKLLESESTKFNGNLKEDFKKLKQFNRIPEDDSTRNENLRNIKKSEEFLTTTQRNFIPSERDNYVVPSNKNKLSHDTWSDDQAKHVLHPLSRAGYGYRNRQKEEPNKNYVSSEVNKPTPGGWSVTVSGTTSEGQFVPNLEMRLTFPHSAKPDNIANQSGADDKEIAKEKRENFPCLVTNQRNNTTNPSSRTESSHSQPFPQIVKHASSKKPKRYENSHSTIIQNPGKLEPRQTRTSSQRLLLNRPQTFITPAEFISISPHDNTYKEILEKFPEILRITGNAINPEQKPKVPNMSEKDIARNMYKDT